MYILLILSISLEQREQVQGTKSGGKQEQASKSLLPVESHKMHLIPPAKSCDNTCDVLSDQGSSLETLCPMFSMGPGHESPSI